MCEVPPNCTTLDDVLEAKVAFSADVCVCVFCFLSWFILLGLLKVIPYSKSYFLHRRAKVENPVLRPCIFPIGLEKQHREASETTCITSHRGDTNSL